MSTVIAGQCASDLVLDPLKFKQIFWPDMVFYDKQVEIIQSVIINRETMCPAGNALGKDFVAGFISLYWFCSRTPARVVTTSVDNDQLANVLWGEIRQLIRTAAHPLSIRYNHLHIRKVMPDGELEPKSEIIGRTAKKGEGLLGRHLPPKAKEDGRTVPRTLVIFDEASGIEQQTYESVDTWAHRKLVIGNPYPCENFFKKGVKEGDLEDEFNPGVYYRKVIRIKAEDSPNVQLAEAELAAKKKPSHTILIPGVIDYATYKFRRKHWDPVRQCIGLDAEFYEGADALLFPPAWLNAAETRAAQLPKRNRGKAMGIDTAEGRDSSVWCIIDDLGIIHMVVLKTPDTSEVVGITLGLMKEYGVPPENIVFDRGGGGKQHADQIRKVSPDYKGVRTVGFGESATDPHKFKRMRTSQQKFASSEMSYVYKNRRAEMYDLVSQAINPDNEDNPIFGIPAEYTELRRQLSVMQRKYDGEGRLYLPPKDKRSDSSKEETIRDMLGCSPDEADALVLAMFGLTYKDRKFVVSSMTKKRKR